MDTIVVFAFDYNQAAWIGPCGAFSYFSVMGRQAETTLSANRLFPPPTYTPLPTATPTPAVDDPPVVGQTRLDPPSYWRTGGPLTVALDASDTDNTRVSSGFFQVTYPGGDIQTVGMGLVSGTTATGTWAGTFQVPNPSGATDEVYGIRACVVEDFPPRRVVCAAPVNFTVSTSRFSDVPRDFWAYPYIEYLATQGIISGYADNTFRPNNNITRGQVAKMITLAQGWTPLNPPTPTFIDVPPAHPFYQFHRDRGRARRGLGLRRPHVPARQQYHPRADLEDDHAGRRLDARSTRPRPPSATCPRPTRSTSSSRPWRHTAWCRATPTAPSAPTPTRPAPS